MSHRTAKLRANALFQNLERMSATAHVEDGDEDTARIVALHGQAVEVVADTSRQPRMKKFRFQLLHRWLTHNFAPCKAADIGGGKGLLAHLLIGEGWDVTVIDPIGQALPTKYKDIDTDTRVKIDPQVTVPHLDAEFAPDQAAGFDLLIGLHAHGCNAAIINAAAAYGCGFVIFPCCVIDEPFYPPLGVHWLESLADYAIRQGHTIHPFRLNFKGQNIGLCADGSQRMRRERISG
jgi:hypothetical protein